MRRVSRAIVAALVLFAGLCVAFLATSRRGGGPGGAGDGGALRGDSGAGASPAAGAGGRDAPRSAASGEAPRTTRQEGTPRGAPPPPGRGGAAGEGAATDVAKGPVDLLAGSSELQFELTDEAGRPPAGAAVTLLWGRASRRATCDAAGLAAFPGIAGGLYAYEVDVPGRPRLASARQVDLGPGEARRIAVRVGTFDLSIAGRVLRRDGQPVPGITVEARKQLGEGSDGELVPADGSALAATSGEGGAYEIRGLDAADYRLTTRPADGLPPVERVYRAGARSADLVIGDALELSIHGLVTTRKGEPIARARVLPLGHASRQAETDEEGLYRIDIEVAEEHAVGVVVASKDGFREGRVNVRLEEARDGAVEADIVLDPLGPRGSVSGLIVDTDGDPVPGETAYFHSAALSARYQATSDADGRFALEDIQAGDDYRVWVYPRGGYKDYARSPVEVLEEGTELEIVLEPLGAGSLRGRMVDASGAPVPRFSLWVRSMKALGNAVPVTSDEAGGFEVEDVPEGELLFETRSLPRITVRGVRLEAGASAEAELVIDWGPHSLAGTVVDEGGRPVAGAAVSLHWARSTERSQSSSFRNAVTDASGRFVFSELGPGEHKVQVTTVPHAPGQETYDVGSGAPEPVIRLRKKAGGQ
ncbi:MAG: carboxypeptidase regulatory-like domain-containing protein [Planctomycetes bacterium]|nr:carboxypeptidase regulatory-like domain-containing protein [Planctomycetota bacterium]